MKCFKLFSCTRKSLVKYKDFLVINSFFIFLNITVIRVVIKLFTAQMSKNFRFPSSMPEYLRRSAFNNITNVEFESEEEFWLEVGNNLLFFYKELEKGEFAGHDNEWVTVHNQRVIEYGQMYDDDKLDHILEIMPGAVQLLVDQIKLPRSPLVKMVTVQRVNNGNDYKV